MPVWAPIWVMPNLRLQEPIEGKRAALVPWLDPRIIALAKKHRRFNTYLARFTDAFGVPQQPAVLIAKKSTAKTARIRVEAMASFRDLIVMSVVPYNRALMLVYPNRGRGIVYSNNFWLHPWVIDKNYEWLVTKSMASLGLHEVKKFKGQATPEVFSQELNPYDIDKALLEALLDRWHMRYFKPRPTWNDRALFRALNMANTACQLPSVVDTTIFDIGRALALWVSAFEILVHPGSGGKSNLAAVYGALDKVDYATDALKRKRYWAYDPAAKRKTRTILARRIYNELYDRRNAFLHGNPVKASSLLFNRASLLNLAPSLFRMALTQVLDLRFRENAPPASDVEAFVEHHSRHAEFNAHQSIHERALWRTYKPIAPDD